MCSLYVNMMFVCCTRDALLLFAIYLATQGFILNFRELIETHYVFVICWIIGMLVPIIITLIRFIYERRLIGTRRNSFEVHEKSSHHHHHHQHDEPKSKSRTKKTMQTIVKYSIMFGNVLFYIVRKAFTIIVIKH